MIKYNKLVRDNIPKLIISDGKKPVIRTLNKETYLIELRKKIVEEAKELNSAISKEEMIDELADIYELLDYILIEEKIDLNLIKKRRILKNMSNGGFDDKVFLEYVEDIEKA